MTKTYSETTIAIDLIQDAYNTSNPIIIAEKAEELFNIELNIDRISDYLNINHEENYELESRKEYYQVHY